MRHRREAPETVAFDLVPEDEAIEADGALTEAHVQPSVVGRAFRAVEGWPRRRKVVVTGTLAGLVVAGFGADFTVDAVRDRALRAQLVTAPGGVIGLADAPTQTWRTELDNPEPVAMMDGLLVVLERESPDTFMSSDDVRTLTALDPDDGAVRWSTTVEDAWNCGTAPGPAGTWWSTVGAAPEIICPTSDGVVVVGADGRTIARRELDGRTDGEVVLAAPGAVLRVGRVGAPVPAPPIVDRALGVDFATRDVLVRLEDAETGVERWATTVPGATAPAGTAVDTMYSCVVWSGDSPTVDQVSDDTGFISDVGARRVSLEGCGVNVTIDLASGEVVRAVDIFDPATGGWDPGAIPLDGDGYATRLPYDGSGDEVYRIWREDGTVVSDVVGSVTHPAATDGSPAEVLLTNGPRGMTAFDPTDATKLWTHSSQAMLPFVRTEDALIVPLGGSVVALEPRTGRELWNRSPLDLRPDASGHPGQVVGAFTDGHRVVLVELLNGGFIDNDDGTGEVRLRALDLSTGDLLWTTQRTAPLPQSIGGRLYEVHTDAMVQLG